MSATDLEKEHAQHVIRHKHDRAGGNSGGVPGGHAGEGVARCLVVHKVTERPDGVAGVEGERVLERATGERIGLDGRAGGEGRMGERGEGEGEGGGRGRGEGEGEG